MPLLGAVAAFGIARSGKLFVRAVIGMALGFADPDKIENTLITAREPVSAFACFLG